MALPLIITNIITLNSNLSLLIKQVSVILVNGLIIPYEEYYSEVTPLREVMIIITSHYSNLIEKVDSN